MKVALCFIINYEHILNKEHIWKDWIEPNKDIINVYFYYKDVKKIKSEWILEHTIPPNYIHETSYFFVIPAYMSLMNFAINHDAKNQWVCMLTDSCCPIISPKRFRYLFYTYYNKSILSWKKSWWNVDFHKRANLALLPINLRLANDPWFVMKRENVLQCLHFINKEKKLTQTICSGGLANESLFAIILQVYNQLDNVICSVTHTTEWARPASSTSPHLFEDADEEDIKFINKSLNNDKCVMFIRKISPEFPDDVLKNYIYNYSKEKDDELILSNPFLINERILLFAMFIYYGLPIIVLLYVFKYVL
jgi:hypothetical protein